MHDHTQRETRTKAYKNIQKKMNRFLLPDSVATAFASNVFPVPGGPYRRTPLGGALKPVKRSGRKLGKITASWSVCFA